MAPGSATTPEGFQDELALEQAWKGTACGPGKPYWGKPRLRDLDALVSRREYEMFSLRGEGCTFAALGERFDISRERARQVLVGVGRKWEQARMACRARYPVSWHG